MLTATPMELVKTTKIAQSCHLWLGNASIKYESPVREAERFFRPGWEFEVAMRKHPPAINGWAVFNMAGFNNGRFS